MSDLVEKLRAGFFIIEKEAADEIERLQKRAAELEDEKSTIVAATGERCANICKTAADRLVLIADDDFNGVEELEKCEDAIRTITKEST